MKRRALWVGVLALAAALVFPELAWSQARRGAKAGAASGAVLSFLMGGDLWDIAEASATGAAVGAVGGAVAGSDKRRRNDRYELDRLRRQEIEMLDRERMRADEEARYRQRALAAEASSRRREEERMASLEAEQRRQEEERYRATLAETRRLEDERRITMERETARMEEERRKLAAERRKLEATVAASQANNSSGSGANLAYPQTEEEWIAAVGDDNYMALIALIDCQHARASLLAQAGRTVENPNYQLASRWVEALVAVDSNESSTAKGMFESLAILDDEVNDVQQASLLADKAILDVRQARRDEGITCKTP